MSLTIEVLNGHRYGETMSFEKTVTVGRLADISFDDSKMSKIHALFEVDPQLGWVIKDNDSKNGLSVNGENRRLHKLAEGDMIEIGSTRLRVSSVSSFWKSQLNQLLIETLDKAKNAPLTMYPFRAIPVLKFIQGLQLGQKLILEYGPRYIGGESEDIQLFEPLCPDLAFELRRNPKGVVFETNYPKIVLLNKKSVHKKVLKKGDQISIHDTIIEVDFLNL